MRKRTTIILSAYFLLTALPLAAQQPCQGIPVIVNTPEDHLMLAYNKAGGTQEQIQLLQQFALAHPNSKFLPCADEYLTMAYLKAGNYDQAIAAGEKDLARHYLTLNLLTSLLKAYASSGKASDQAFQLIMETPQQVKKEIAATVTVNTTAAQAKKAEQEAAQQRKEYLQNSEYTFFQLLPRVTDPAQRIKYLDEFTKTFPNSAYAKQAAVQYFIAAETARQKDKLLDYGEKAVAADPNNPATLNMVADGYVTFQMQFEKAAAHAKKALELLKSAKKPAGMSDEQFQTYQKQQTGLARSTLGYIELRGSKGNRGIAAAIRDLKEAADLLEGKPNFQARALYYLGFAYERRYPPQHRLAEEALDKAAALNTPWKSQVDELLKKVRAARGR